MAERHFSLSNNWWCGIRTSLHLYLRNIIIGMHNKQITFNWPNISDLYKELVVWERRYNHCAFVQDRTPRKNTINRRTAILDGLFKQNHQTRKAINLLLCQKEKVREEMECFIWKDEWFGNHPAQTHSSCLCLAEGGPFSHGVRAWQGSAGAEGSSLDQKILWMPWVASQGSSAGRKSEFYQQKLW